MHKVILNARASGRRSIRAHASCVDGVGDGVEEGNRQHSDTVKPRPEKLPSNKSRLRLVAAPKLKVEINSSRGYYKYSYSNK